jgi:GTP-binding protein HflX
MIIFDDELTGSQLANIEKVLGVPIIDRSDLILDIFASRCKNSSSKSASRVSTITNTYYQD